MTDEIILEIIKKSCASYWPEVNDIFKAMQQLRDEMQKEIQLYIEREVSAIQRIESLEEQLAAASRSNPRWVKATHDNLPNEYGAVHWRDSETKLPVTAGGAYNAVRKGRPELVEYLDESPSPSPSSSVQVLVDEIFDKEIAIWKSSKYNQGIVQLLEDLKFKLTNALKQFTSNVK